MHSYLYFSVPRLLLLLLMPVLVGAAQARCFDEAGIKYGIDPLLLNAIAQVESAMNPQAINLNRNGTQDLGLMQINSSHLERLRKIGVTREKLLTDACLSVMVGAEILAGFIAQFGYTWRAVGAYNAGGESRREKIRERYARKVGREYNRLSAGLTKIAPPENILSALDR